MENTLIYIAVSISFIFVVFYVKDKFSHDKKLPFDIKYDIK